MASRAPRRLPVVWGNLFLAAIGAATIGYFGQARWPLIVVSVGYPLMDLGLLGILMRAARFDIARRAPYILIGGSLFLMLVADIGYMLMGLRHRLRDGRPSGCRLAPFVRMLWRERPASIRRPRRFPSVSHTRSPPGRCARRRAATEATDGHPDSSPSLPRGLEMGRRVAPRAGGHGPAACRSVEVTESGAPRGSVRRDWLLDLVRELYPFVTAENDPERDSPPTTALSSLWATAVRLDGTRFQPTDTLAS